MEQYLFQPAAEHVSSGTTFPANRFEQHRELKGKKYTSIGGRAVHLHST
jgi:predicted GIY-YIG superfamily endonuclease